MDPPELKIIKPIIVLNVPVITSVPFFFWETSPMKATNPSKTAGVLKKLILGFVMNLVFARITPFKNIFFTTGHSLFFACVLSLILKAHKIADIPAIIIGGLILGFVSAALPQLCQR